MDFQMREDSFVVQQCEILPNFSQQTRQPDRVLASRRYAPASQYAAGYANVVADASRPRQRGGG